MPGSRTPISRGVVVALSFLVILVLSRFGRSGRYAGQLHWVHNMAVDSRGNIYTAEVDNGKRVQKFAYQGLFPITD